MSLMTFMIGNRFLSLIHIDFQSNIDPAIRVMLSSFSEQRIHIDERDGKNRTAMYCGAEKGHLTAVQLLVEHGADVNAEGPYARTALQVAAANEYEAIVCATTAGAQGKR